MPIFTIALFELQINWSILHTQKKWYFGRHLRALRTKLKFKKKIQRKFVEDAAEVLLREVNEI